MMNTPNLWATTYQQILKNHQNPTEARFWLDALQWNGAERLPQGRVRILLSAPNAYYANFITAAYRGDIESAVSQVLGESCELQIETNLKEPSLNLPSEAAFSQGETLLSSTQDFLVADEIAEQKISSPLAPPLEELTSFSERLTSAGENVSSTRISLQETLDTSLTFNNYIVGPSNQFAYASAYALANKPNPLHNPLFIYGPPAVGKTHLLHAIGNHIKLMNPNLRCYFVSAEHFVNEFITSLQHKNPSDFRSKYRQNVDVLLIDDVQFIVGKDRSEEEFIHTFNTLIGMKKLIILTSDKSPKDIDGLEERIRTRFEMGLVADIRTPEIETRIAILKAKAEQHQVYLPDDVATFLGTYVKDSVRSLHGALIRVHQYAELTGSEISIELAKHVLQTEIPEEGKEYTVEVIINAVCKHFSIKTKDLKGVSRAKIYSLPRQIAMYLIRRYASLGLREIGQIFGKDHSTVLHACQKIDSLIEQDPSIKKSVESIREFL